MKRHDLIVIGSGPAGQRAAIAAAKLGKDVAIVDKMRALGGVAINTGTIPSKTLREAALDLSGLRLRRMYGEYQEPRRLAIGDLLARASDVMRHERQVVRDQLLRNGVTVLEGTARFTGANEVAIDGAAMGWELQAPAVVIAVGTVPALPAGLVVDHARVLTSDDILQLPRMPRTMVVVGAGIIGVEYATIFGAMGVEVTLADKREHILEMVDEEILDGFAYRARELGVVFRLGEEVARVDVPSADHAIVLMNSGKRIATDLVLVSAGRLGATVELDLAKAGLQADDRGRIAVNQHYQTTVPHIYAAGDCIGLPALASTGAEQGRLAALHAFGYPATSLPELYPFGIYAVPELSWVGANERDLTARGVPFETGVARYREIARGQILGDEDGMLKLIFHLDTRHILGVWVLGTQATELVHIGQAAMALGGTLDFFLHNVFNYPTLAECYKVAALDGFNKLNSLGAMSAASAAPKS
ncbi:MAG TPA: Si-specific NAD(P)(+) transhydrogenase [Candidatus Limnocylindria bacterium]|nr:Si-specific NAD(P)(+) transhydrogenase [Candidatus Limnocylindria bacterium]